MNAFLAASPPSRQ